jgi:hypothetical protein
MNSIPSYSPLGTANTATDGWYVATILRQQMFGRGSPNRGVDNETELLTA